MTRSVPSTPFIIQAVFDAPVFDNAALGATLLGDAVCNAASGDTSIWNTADFNDASLGCGSRWLGQISNWRCTNWINSLLILAFRSLWFRILGLDRHGAVEGFVEIVKQVRDRLLG